MKKDVFENAIIALLVKNTTEQVTEMGWEIGSSPESSRSTAILGALGLDIHAEATNIGMRRGVLTVLLYLSLRPGELPFVVL